MAHRILVDENTSPRVAERLRDDGHDAVHVSEPLGFGATDRAIADHAEAEGYVLPTHDDDFLLPGYADDVPVPYYSDDTLDADEIADRVDRLTRYAPERGDLPDVTTLGTWD